MSLDTIGLAAVAYQAYVDASIEFGFGDHYPGFDDLPDDATAPWVSVARAFSEAKPSEVSSVEFELIDGVRQMKRPDGTVVRKNSIVDVDVVEFRVPKVRDVVDGDIDEGTTAGRIDLVARCARPILPRATVDRFTTTDLGYAIACLQVAFEPLAGRLYEAWRADQEVLDALAHIETVSQQGGTSELGGLLESERKRDDPRAGIIAALTIALDLDIGAPRPAAFTGISSWSEQAIEASCPDPQAPIRAQSARCDRATWGRVLYALCTAFGDERLRMLTIPDLVMKRRRVEAGDMLAMENESHPVAKMMILAARLTRRDVETLLDLPLEEGMRVFTWISGALGNSLAGARRSRRSRASLAWRSRKPANSTPSKSQPS